MPRTETITVYLLKESVSAAADALKPDLDTPYTEHALDAAETTGTVYVAELNDNEPEWVRLLSPFTQPPVADQTHSTSALLVLQSAGRWFAIAFGHGRHLLDPEIYVRRFGLRVALNAADPEQLRGAQARSFAEYALHTQRQVSRLSGVEALELDVERDLITAMSGAMSDPTLGKRVEGRDSVRLTAELDAGDLAATCAKLLTESQRTAYKQRYPWIDNVEELTDPAVTSRLKLRAATALGQRRFSEFDLFPPELVAGEIVQFNTFPREGGLVVIEPDSSLLRYPLRAPTDAAGAEAALRRYKLIGVDANGSEVDRWTFWDCLHHEFQQSGQTIILDSGRWYRVEQNFANNVEEFIDSLGPSNLALPPARRGETEGAYNARAAQTKGLALLDKQLIRLTGQSPIEACDLFSKTGHFVHVKHRKGGSAPLSHLFGQALVSAECLVGEPDFRRTLRAHLTGIDASLAARITEPPAAPNHPIVLALITKSTTARHPARELPFFSKVFLRQTVRRLRNMNFKVYVDEIPTSPLLPGPKPRAPSPAAQGRRATQDAPTLTDAQ